MTTSDLQQLDKQHLWHPFTPMSLWLEADPLVIVGGEGFHLIDSDGNRYLDGVSSLWCNVHGHRVPEIDQAIRDQLDRIAHSTLLGLANEPSILLADRLMKLVPPNLQKVFYSDAGATSTEIAFKLAVQYWHNTGHPEKNEFIAFTEAYHGDTVGAMSVGRMPAFHRAYLPLMFKVHYAPTPRGEGAEARRHEGMEGARTPESKVPSSESEAAGQRPADAPSSQSAIGHRSSAIRNPQSAIDPESAISFLSPLRRLLEEHGPRVAGICIEPVVQGAGGMIVQPEGFLRGVRQLADEFNTLLICDEVATGFARTGKMFAVEHEGVQPDLMTVAKGITGGYLPLAATFATHTIFDAFLGPPSAGKTFFHGHTYTGNPLACAAAIANIDLMLARDTVGNVARNAPELARLLQPLNDLPHVGEIRQKGYMVGIELVKGRDTKEPFDPAMRVGHAVCARIRQRGVILRPLGDVIVLMPPPAMGMAHLRTIVEAVRAELAALP